MKITRDKNGQILSRPVALAVFYGCGIGVGIVSYLARSDLIKFKYRSPFPGSITVIDMLGYPKQQEIFWYLAALGLPLLIGLLYGYMAGAPRAALLREERGWWASLLIFILQSPLFALISWPGAMLAILHVAVLAILPIAAGLILRNAGGNFGDTLLNSRRIKIGVPEIAGKWVAPILLLLFAGFVSNEFLTMFDLSVFHIVTKSLLWSGLIGIAYFALFKFLSRFVDGKKTRGLSPLSGDRAAWGMMPVVFLPLCQLVWGHFWTYGLMFVAAFFIGAVLFIRTPGKNPGRLAMFLLPLGISMALLLNPQYRFAPIDVVHEGQQLAFAQCVMRGLWPGVERAVKYGPLYELTEGWTMKLFGAQVYVLRMYFLWAQVLGYWFGCLLLAELTKRRWAIVYGWLGYLGFSIAALYGTGRFNGLRAGLPMLAIFLWARRCRGGGIGWLISAGAVGAMGALYSVEFGLAGTVALLAGLVSRGFGEGIKSGIRVVLREAVIMALGALIVAIPFMLLYIAHGGLLSLVSGMYEYAEGFRLGYGAFPFPAFPWLDGEQLGYLGFGYFIEHIRFYFVPFVGVAFGGWLAGRRLSHRWTPDLAAMTALWVYGLAAFRSVMGRSDFFHLIQGVAPGIIMLFILVDRLWGELSASRALEKISRRLAQPVIGLSFIILMILPFINFKYMSASLHYYLRFRIQKDMPAIEAFYSSHYYAPLKLARAKNIWVTRNQAISLEGDTDFILKNTARDEPLHLAPLSGLLFFLADRTPLTRYCMAMDAVTPETRRQIVAQLMTTKPRLILIQMHLGMDFTYEEEHPDEVKYIREHYVFRERAGDMDVYQRL